MKSLNVKELLKRLKVKKECEYTQAKVAELLDCERSLISLYETGKRVIPIEQFFFWGGSCIYHVSADYILNGKKPKGSTNLISEIKKLCDQYESDIM